MGCKKINITIKDNITCAKICNIVPFIMPEIDYNFNNWLLIGENELYDVDDYNHKWQIIDSKNNILFDTGYGDYNVLLSNPNNTSTHGIFNLGENNSDIYSLLTNFYVLKNKLFIKYKIQHKNFMYEYEKLKYYING